VVELEQALAAFGFEASDFAVRRIGSGHIHDTYHLAGRQSFILQRVNKDVFKQPDAIAANLRFADDYLKSHVPGYRFLSVIATLDHKDLFYDSGGDPWRMFPFIDNTLTIDKIANAEEAFRAAAGFAQLTRNLDKIDVRKFCETIPGFHDLGLRYDQFEKAMAGAGDERKKKAQFAIDGCHEFKHLVGKYETLIRDGALRLRVTHNDTKINNILFDATTRQTVCVIDLDTLMPGYFIYDVGDMVRTFVSPVSEEERDYSKIEFRKDVYDAVVDGYLSEMKEVMSASEMEAISFAGKMMTYMMALRFTTDFLNEDVYYHTTYSGQNLVRAGNQLKLLDILEMSVH
jgi:Ser/Thr protein kinase RdoA (MazF antagonist)